VNSWNFQKSPIQLSIRFNCVLRERGQTLIKLHCLSNIQRNIGICGVIFIRHWCWAGFFFCLQKLSSSFLCAPDKSGEENIRATADVYSQCLDVSLRQFRSGFLIHWLDVTTDMSKTQRVLAATNRPFHPLCYVTHLEHTARYTFGILEYTSNVAAPSCLRSRSWKSDQSTEFGLSRPLAQPDI